MESLRGKPTVTLVDAPGESYLTMTFPPGQTIISTPASLSTQSITLFFKRDWRGVWVLPYSAPQNLAYNVQHSSGMQESER